MGRNKAEMDHPPKFRSSVPASGFIGRSNTNMAKKQARQIQKMLYQIHMARIRMNSSAA
jgi:hypothetical protein